MKEDKINVCNSCKNPVVGTFMFSGAELYCPSCGAKGDIFWGELVEVTPELKEKQKLIHRKFNEAREHVHSGGGMMKDCRKCNKEAHQYHLTKKERALHYKGIKLLKEMRLTPPQR